MASSSQTFARHGFSPGDRCLSAEQRHRLAAGEVGSPARSSPSGLDRRLTGWLAGCGGEKIDTLPGETTAISGLHFQNKTFRLFSPPETPITTHLRPRIVYHLFILKPMQVRRKVKTVLNVADETLLKRPRVTLVVIR